MHPRRRRTTVKQQVVMEALGAENSFRSAQQLYMEIRQKRPIRIGLTSVYRILHALADDGVAETQRAEDGETLYRRRTVAGHRHYLMCRRCGSAIGFTPAALEEYTERLVREHRYTDVTHHVDLYGVCPQCRGT